MNVLLFNVGDKVCGLPLRAVREVMRPRALERNHSLPKCVLGTCLIRQQPTPVIDVAALMGSSAQAPKRLVTVSVGERQVALAVDAVIGTTRIDAQRFLDTTPLVCGDQGVISALTVLDSTLVYLMNSARLLPDDMPELANVVDGSERDVPATAGSSA